MAFQIKNFPSIVAGMINRMRANQSKVTDFRIGGVARTMLEAPAIEIDEAYQQIFNGLMDAIPVATYGSFNFTLLPAVATSGLVRVTITSSATAETIVAGTVFTLQSGGASYTSQSDVTIAAGNTTADVLVAANIAGTAGNIGSGQTFTLAPTISGLVSATNLSAWVNGADAETEDQRKVRFIEYIASLPRGTPGALMYGAKTSALYANGLQTERVQLAFVVEPYLTDNTQPVGLVNLYVHNGVGSTSGALVTQAQNVIYGYTDSSGNVIPGWKAAGVHVVVAAATEVTQAVTCAVTCSPGAVAATVQAAAQAAISTYILGLNIGATLRYSELVYLIMQVPGVDHVNFTTPTADVTCTSSQKLMPGTLTVTAS